MVKHNYEIGKTYGLKRLLSLEKDGNTTVAVVECVRCGKRSVVKPNSLFHDKYTSCICTHINEEIDYENNKRLYAIYHNMKYRCNTKTAPEYYNYGGRGIKVCAEWDATNGFIKFKEWAFANGYDDSLTIDRINPDGDYCPDNCRWITKSQNTSLANKSMRTQHRKSNMGTYYAIDENGTYIEFENAAKFAREHSLNDGSIRSSAHRNAKYGGFRFGFVSTLDKKRTSIDYRKRINRVSRVRVR